MEQVYILGSKKEKCHITIHDNSVSNQHLEIEYLDKDKLRIRDLGSTNGTFVDNQEIKQKIIGSNNEIETGRYKFKGKWLIKEVTKLRNSKEIDFSKEFSELEQDFIRYEKLSKNITFKYTVTKQILRAMIGGLVLIVGKNLENANWIGYGVSASSGILALIIVERAFGDKNYKEAQEKLRLEFIEILACPKCQNSLIGYSYSYWKQHKNCKKCHCIWSK